MRIIMACLALALAACAEHAAPGPNASGAPPVRSQPVALAWNSSGAWATRAADTIEQAREAALAACNERRAGGEACTLSDHFIAANRRRCLVLHRNGARLFVTSGDEREDVTTRNLAFCERGSGAGCEQAYAWCSEPR